MAKSDPLLNNPELVSALQTYSEHLGNNAKELQVKIKDMESELHDYETKSKGMDQIARRFAELKMKSEKLKAEIRRLEQ